jgi:cytochrome P450
MSGATCSMALISFFEAMLLEKPSKAGLFGKLVKAFKKAGLSDGDVQVCAFDFVVAGYLSTTFIIGTGTRNLLNNPEELRELRDNPSLMPGALEEMMRYDGPVQIIDRVAAEDTQLGEYKFKKYDKVIVVVGSANRDPRKFHNADRFLIDRGGEQEQHLGFGDGIHHCIGAPLVRMVAPVAFEMLLTAFPKLAPAGDPQWQTDPYLRAVTNLPLQF